MARCYVDAARYEAAQNQIDKLLAQNPHNIEALVLRAEVTETDPRRSYRQNEYNPSLFSLPPGLVEWEAVLAQNDETYNALAEERLTELYSDALDRELFWVPTLDSLKALGERIIKQLPKNNFLRALYVQGLLDLKEPGRAEARHQIEHIDLTDWEALHQLIDGFHRIEHPKAAAELLQKAEAIKPLDAEFYAGIGRCALRRRQETIADHYFEEALKRIVSENERLGIPMLIGTTYLEVGHFDKAEATLLKALAADPRLGPAHFLMALLADRRGERGAARKYLREAERNADRVEDPTFRETIRAARQAINSPNMSLWNLFRQGPSPFDFDDSSADMDDFEDLPPMRTRKNR